MSAIDNDKYLALHGYTRHNRGCPENKGRQCNCGLHTARNEFIGLFESMERDLDAIKKENQGRIEEMSQLYLDDHRLHKENEALREALKPFAAIQINVTGSPGILYADAIRRVQELLGEPEQP